MPDNTSKELEQPRRDEATADDAARLPPVVGIGASAGGIEALSHLFDAMPPDAGLVFVVVLHLDPTRESQLSAILALHTAMPVVEIDDGMRVAPDHVYVIAPNFDLTLEGDVLRLIEPPQPRGHRHPVDVLFRSLAEQRRERAIAVVLSGTGTNGTQGLKEIKAAGGLILIQDPATARFDGMPRSAISASLADHVQNPGEMGATILRYVQHGYVAAPDAIPAAGGGLDLVLDVLRANAGQDFRPYRPAMLLRRINRRMSLGNIAELGAYIELLRSDAEEIRALVRDMLISVTGFFRDDDAWSAFDEAVITPLVAERDTGAAIRVWVPACATGEEAYSVAMMLVERAEAEDKHFDLKIFASDPQDVNLNTARDGVYPGSSVELLPPERTRRFFEKLDGAYRVRKELRDLIVFARQDVLRDPPFSRMDLITCRNMLIY
ncbi:MAG: chemotaxis protein CheB, partial [Acetobacteraceae bacterium]